MRRERSRSQAPMDVLRPHEVRPSPLGVMAADVRQLMFGVPQSRRAAAPSNATVGCGTTGPRRSAR
jgi:hypothetical protein